MVDRTWKWSSRITGRVSSSPASRQGLEFGECTKELIVSRRNSGSIAHRTGGQRCMWSRRCLHQFSEYSLRDGCFEQGIQKMSTPESRGYVRVLIVDDHPVVRAGLASLLRRQHGVKLSGAAHSGEEAIELMKHLYVDV